MLNSAARGVKITVGSGAVLSECCCVAWREDEAGAPPDSANADGAARTADFSRWRGVRGLGFEGEKTTVEGADGGCEEVESTKPSFALVEEEEESALLRSRLRQRTGQRSSS